jgi:hypothetical protein
MPLTITIPAKDMYDPREKRFITFKEQTLVLEHSLISIAKWESKWHKAYLSKEKKTEEESLDYLRCMCINQTVNTEIFKCLDQKTVNEIAEYIKNPMTATTFNHQNDKRPNRDVITNELVYFWMSNYGIPFDPCQKWHFNHLMALIEVASVKNTPPKKMKNRDILNQNLSLNAKRRAALHSKG